MRKFLIALVVALSIVWAVKLSKLRRSEEPTPQPAPSVIATATAVSSQAVSAPEPQAIAEPAPKLLATQQAPAQERKRQTQPAEPAPLPQPKALPQAEKLSPLQAKLKTLDEILRSGNDNDPRLDKDFNNLTQEEKRAFEAKYQETAREQFNRRGTIVYLLGRNPQTYADWNFLREAATEPPCLGMENCGTRPTGDAALEPPGIELTLSYPAMMALRQAELAVENGNAAGMDVVNAAAQSSSRVVSEEAKRFLKTHR